MAILTPRESMAILTPRESMAILTPRESMVILILLICESIGLLSQLFLGKNRLNNDVHKENAKTSVIVLSLWQEIQYKTETIISTQTKLRG